VLQQPTVPMLRRQGSRSDKIDKVKAWLADALFKATAGTNKNVLLPKTAAEIVPVSCEMLVQQFLRILLLIKYQ
jgi:hypothetical protein